MANEYKIQDTIFNIAKRDEALISLERLSKRLTYILRYGALKEGLEVNENGYVNFDDLMKLNLMQDYTPDEVLHNIKTSVSYRNVRRFNWRENNGKCFVRAAYLRNFEKNPYHFGTQVPTLFEWSMRYVLGHLDNYNLLDFPDEYIIRAMIHRLKRQKKLSNKVLEVLLVPTLTHLDLEGIYLTKNTLRIVWTQCPNLTAVSLKHCGYIMTDCILAQFTKNCPKLEQLNLCACTHLTSKCLSILVENLPHLQALYFSSVPTLKYDSVLSFIRDAKDLNFLDVYCLRVNYDEYDTLVKVAQRRGVKLLLRERKKENSI